MCVFNKFQATPYGAVRLVLIVPFNCWRNSTPFWCKASESELRPVQHCKIVNIPIWANLFGSHKKSVLLAYQITGIHLFIYIIAWAWTSSAPNCFLICHTWFFQCCAVSPSPIVLKSRALCGVPILVWTSEKMFRIGMCGVPPPHTNLILLSVQLSV